jgi:aspartate 1-decarboxylase
VYWPAGNTTDGGQGQTVAGYNCGAMVETYHVHSHLAIFLNGAALAVPSNIGIVNQAAGDCFYAIHTHDGSGKIHVEGPAPGTYTLGHFFAIWGQPLQRNNIGGHSGMPVVVYLVDDGVVSEYDGDLAAIELTSRRQITIQIGTPIAEVPSFTWTGT